MDKTIVFILGCLCGVMILQAIHDFSKPIETITPSRTPSRTLQCGESCILQGSFAGKNYQNIEFDTLTIKGDTKHLPLHSQYRIKIVQSNTQTVIKN